MCYHKFMNDGLMMVIRDEKGRVVSGVLNPVGKRQGTRHFSTIFNDAVKKIAEGQEDSDDIIMVKKVIAKAKEGDLKAFDIVREEVDGLMPKADGDLGGSIFNIVMVNFDENRNNPT